MAKDKDTSRDKPALPSEQAFSAVQFCPLPDVDETAWLDVIRKMDEVYNDLLEYEVALEEKNTELEETQQFIFSVLTSMSDILIICDSNGRVEDVNRAMVKLAGRSEQELRGRALPELFADEASRRKAAEFPVLTRDEGVHDCEVVFAGPDGAAVPVSLNCSARSDMNGRQVGMVLVGRPIGELRRAYQALREAHEQLKRTQQQLVHSEKMASLGRLVAGVAHELNNPISFVLGNVHAMQRYARRLKTYLEAMHSCSTAHCGSLRRELRIDRIMDDLDPLIEGTLEGAERTRDIVDGLKRFSAPDRGEESVFNLAELVEKSIHWVTQAARSRFDVVRDIPPEIPVSGSPGQMQQVLVNLVQNAFDATAGQESPRLEISGRIGDGQVALDFHDNGSGIKPEHISRLFDPFFTTKPIGKGTGLGLSISYGIVERHNGELSVANHPDGGAVFTLRLALAK